MIFCSVKKLKMWFHFCKCSKILTINRTLRKPENKKVIRKGLDSSALFSPFLRFPPHYKPGGKVVIHLLTWASKYGTICKAIVLYLALAIPFSII